jgi:hypothetical protein
MKTIDLSKIKLYWLLVCIFVANISQTPQLLEANYFKSINIICWGILFLLNIPLLIKGSYLKNKIIQKILLLLYFYILFLFTSELIQGEGYLINFNLYPMALAIFIFLNVFLIIKPNDEKSIKLILLTYIISALITLLNVFFLYYLNVTSTMLSWHSIYTEKNTIAVINLFVLISLYLFKSDKILLRVGKFILILFLIYFLIILKSRTAIVGGLFAVVCHFIFIRNSIKNKFLIFSIITVFSMIIFLNDSVYDLLIVKLFLNDKIQNGSIDLSMVTSSRFDYLSIFASSIQDNFLIGSGYVRLESGFLYSLISFGFIGAIPYIALAVLPFLSSIQRRKFTNNQVSSLLLYSSAVAIINFLLEQRAPFGPGTKFSFLWIMYGIYAKHYSDVLIKNKREQQKDRS